jgi:hypothetical protein
MRILRATVLFALAAQLTASPARGDFVWEFDLAGVPTTNFVIPAVGATVDVQIYLKETNGGTILATQKLFGAGVQVTFNSPSGVAAVSSSANIAPNTAFNDAGSYKTPVTSASAKVSEATDGSVFVAPDALNRILFGTFTFTGQAPGTVTLTALRFNPAPDDRIITGTGNVLDGLVPSGTAQISVLGTATPEPGSLLLAGIAGMALTSYGARRKLLASSFPQCKQTPIIQG